jgi:hypothetical protein
MTRNNRIRNHKDPNWSEQVRLSTLLNVIEQTDGHDYTLRNRAILTAMAVASTAGYPAGIRVDPENPAWPVVFIQLPTGQVSWHLPQFETAWDGHTTEEKYERAHAFIDAVLNRNTAAYHRENRPNPVPGGGRS